MTIAYAVALRNSMLDEITALIDVAVGGGFLEIYDGSRPATGGTVTTLLAHLVLTDPAAAAAAAGVLTLSTINDDVSADATGTATWFRITDSAGVFVMDGDVGTSGSDLNMDSVSFTAGQNVAVNSFVITGGNP